MIVFWILAALMTLVALAFVLVPLLRPRAATGPSAHDANLVALRSQRSEIDADVASGVLPADAREEAIGDLVERAQQDLEPRAAGPAAATQKPWIAALAAGIAVPLIAFGTYLAVGAPGSVELRAVAPGAAKVDDKQIVAMVESLARKVRDRPDDAQGWTLLARSMAALGRFREASEAYERVVKLVPNDADVLADYADLLAMAQGSLRGRPYELAKQALEINPRNDKALALAASGAADTGDFATALRYWQDLAQILPPGSADEGQVRTIIAETRAKIAETSPKIAETSPKTAESARGAPGGDSKSVSGRVSVAPEVAPKVAAGDTLFIYARAEGGPRFPLAILRGTAGQLPMRFALDDTMAMSPNTRLSSAQAVRIEARISKSGDAMPKPGDLVGTSAVVKPGARDVTIVIDKVLP